MKHSPGPWRQHGDDLEPADANGSPIVSGNAFQVRNPADLRLIIAAPEMLELLREPGKDGCGSPECSFLAWTHPSGLCWRHRVEALLERLE